MKTFEKFYFKSFTFDKQKLEAKFTYAFDNEAFFEEVIFFENPDFIARNDINNDIINNMLFHLHLAL
jgi:hypothetical protein